MATHWLVGGHLAIGLDTMFQTVQLPAGVPHLDASLANMDRDTLTLWRGNRLLATVLHGITYQVTVISSVPLTAIANKQNCLFKECSSNVPIKL